MAQLHIDSLRDKTNSKSIRKALEALPKGSNALDLAYDGAIQRIENQREGFRDLAKKLLGWLTFSERLMTVIEIQHALAVEPGTPDMDEDNLNDVDEIVGFCAGLVIVDEETQIIRLVHYTTQDYFRRNRGRISASAQQDIAKSCLTYLLYDQFEEGWVCKRDLEIRRRKNPFLLYAASHWAAHTNFCGQQNVYEPMMSFVENHRKVSSAAQVMFHPDNEEHWITDTLEGLQERGPFSAMHVLAYLGYEGIISELLHQGFRADTRDAIYRTPLWWAA